MSLTCLSVHTAELRLEMVFVFDAGTLEGSKLKEKVHLGKSHFHTTLMNCYSGLLLHC